MSEWAQIVQTLGVAGACLLGLCMFCWRVLVWIRPWIEKVFSAHLELVDKTSGAIQGLTESLHRQESTLSQVAKTLEKNMCRYRE